jgi:hypothetical protein
MFRSPLLAAALLLTCPAAITADTLDPRDLAEPQDPDFRGRAADVPGTRVKTVAGAEEAASVEITFGMQQFVPASANLGDIPGAGPETSGRFYCDGSAVTAAARALVDVSRGSTTPGTETEGFEAAGYTDPSICRTDPEARDALAEALAASF